MKNNFKFKISNFKQEGGFTPTPKIVEKNIFGVSLRSKRGFTLFIAMVVTGTLLLIATGVASLAAKQSLISVSGRESQVAFYAADTGLECALYWDVKNPLGEQSAFATSTGSTIYCNRDAANPSNEWVVGGNAVSTFTMTFLPEPYCAIVTVTKEVSGGTTIESSGYNSCSSTNPRRVERAVRAIY